MSHAAFKKFYLVDASQLKQNDDKTSYKARTRPLLTKELQSLDNKMLQIVEDPILSTDEKVLKYNAALAKYQQASEYTQSKSSTFDVQDKPTIKQEDVVEHPINNPLTKISGQYQNRANNLWLILSKEKRLKVSKDGSVTINGESIPQSNITDMIYKAVNPRLKAMNVAGWDKFTDLLSEINVPAVMLANQKQVAMPFKHSPSRKTIKTRATAKPYYKKPDSTKWLAHDQK